MHCAHRYSTETSYQIIHYFTGGSRILRPHQHDYLAWIANGGVPTIEADGRFLSVVNGELVVDPNKDTILAGEEAARVGEIARMQTAKDCVALNAIKQRRFSRGVAKALNIKI